MPTLYDTIRAHPDRTKRWATHLAFWGLLALATWAVIAPLWIGPMPPLTDFGGHAAIADVWARLDDVELYRQWFARRTGLVPNTLPSRFAGLLFPLLDPLASLRLFTSLMMAATVGALVATARAFGRSRWLVFLCLPFLWNTALHWGMVNYVAALPLFFAALALARKAGQSRDWRWAVGLAAVCVASFFAHGLGFVFTVGAAGFVLVFSLRRARQAAYLTAFAPAIALWVHWQSMDHHGKGLPEGGLADMLEHHARWYPPKRKLVRFFEHAINISSGDKEIVLLCVLFGVWLLWMGISRGPATPSAAPATPDQPGWLARLRGALAAFYATLHQHTLLMVTLCLGAAIAVFPSHIAQTNIATRVVPLFVMSAALLPRLPRRSWLAAAGVVIAVASTFWFAHFADQTVADFERTELAPVARLAAKIPKQSRVECLDMPHYNQTSIQGSPLNHNCPGLVQVRTQSFGGFHFPATAFNAIKFTKGHGYISLDRSGFTDQAKLRQWDYVITRGDRHKPRGGVATLVDKAQAEVDGAPTWYLYRVEHPK